MSINHSSSLNNLPETTLWWTQNPQQQQQKFQIMEPIPNPSWPKNLFNLNNNRQEELLEQQQQNNEQEATTSKEEEEEVEKEPMFEKPLTPSDVGKLNRLVIPKQHAEKYFPFPLSAVSASPGSASSNVITSTTTLSSDSGECKGLLLSFEDESGKCWRFRYSYWNSSQSYVLTKGWSRYVKDKRLDAGDVVSFDRHRRDSQRFFIRWRRRSCSGAVGTVSAQVSRAGNNNGKSVGGGSVGWTSGFYCAHPSYPTHHLHQHQQHEGLHEGKGPQSMNQRTRPILGKCSSSKVLRLFGVNMECQPQQHDKDDDDDDSVPDCSYNVVMPSSTQHADNSNNNITNHNQNLYHNNVINHPPNSSYSNMAHQQPYYYTS